MYWTRNAINNRTAKTNKRRFPLTDQRKFSTRIEPFDAAKEKK